MTDPRGFLSLQRRERRLRPVGERIADFDDVHEPAGEQLIVQQATRCMGCAVPFCHTGCPLGNLIPDWNDLIHCDDWRNAWRALDSTNNFPEFTGGLCPAPCEDACVLAIADEPVTIKEIELAIVERAFANGWVEVRPPARATGKTVAVVGSGPAGLAASQQLRRAGHGLTVFERDDRIGGLLRYGIPDYKQPKHAIDRRLSQLEAEGIEFRTGVDVGRDTGLSDLMAGFDAVVLATGAQAPRDLPLPGRELDGIHFAMPYLVGRNRAVATSLGNPPAGRSHWNVTSGGSPISAAGKRVAIIGGGDTSADCLGNVLREGASGVYEIGHGPEPPAAVGRRSSWPERPFVLRQYPVHGEGGERLWQWEPVRFSGRAGQVTKLHGRRLAYPGFDPSARPGARRRRAMIGEDTHIDVDLVLLAVGFTGVELDEPLFRDTGLATTESGTIPVNGFKTALEGLFAAGDCIRGADLIVTAIADGRECARAVDRFLQGATRLPSRDAVRLSHTA